MSNIYTKINFYLKQKKMYSYKEKVGASKSKHCVSRDHQMKLKGISINDCMVEIEIKKASLFWKKGMDLN